MKILVTGDFQADYQNLDLCQQAWDEILAICELEAIKAVIVAGDLKQLYNPVDARVIRWWFDAIKQAHKNDIDVYANLGNHDRLGLYVSLENWFPILRKAGLHAFDKPTVQSIGDVTVAFLPYRNSAKLLKEMADSLASQVTTKPSLLIFHGEVKGAKYNQYGQRAESGIEAAWLHASRYSYCIGGHFHMQQQIGENLWYCGSPFAEDWGEANQQKGYLVTDGYFIRSVPSQIPGWYDPTWPNFNPPKSWRGARVRVHIECSSSVAYVSEVERCRLQAQKRYEGAEINVSATVRQGVKGNEPKLVVTDPDKVKIREYVRQTCPENISLEKVEKYLTTKVTQQTGKWERSGTGVQFIKAQAKNFLSFQELEVDWAKKGIVVVQGTNKDRSGKSNGSGKTSLLQTIPVALFGNTFKGQKHDRWAKRGSEEKAFVKLELRDSKNRIIKIVRSRKPSQLRLWVDGKEQSTGMSPVAKDGTQSLIEKLTGFTWQTLANAVYIDQEVAYEFIAGTKKSRTDVLSKIQNLERFTKALEVVRKDRANAEAWSQQVEESLSVLRERIDGCKKKLSMLVDESESRLDDARAELEKRRNAKERNDALVMPKIKTLDIKLKKAEANYESMRDASEKCKWALDQWKTKRDVLNKQRPAVDSLVGTCSMCRQSVSQEHLDYVNKAIDKALGELKPAIEQAQAKYTKSLQVLALAEAECEQIGIERNKLMDAQKRIALSLTECERSFRELQRREHNESGRKQEVKAELREAIKQRKTLEQHQVQHRTELEFYQYCEKALSRDGIPAFLNALLCGPLNTAAEFYSELFADKALQVRFELENGEFVPVVLNATGGESIEDQSDGERALAGLIASFALRETTPKCNLLILDEPGNGLDPSAARQFAKGLRGLLSKFDSIWLTTHNSAIASELVDQSVINVIKQSGVSTVT